MPIIKKGYIFIAKKARNISSEAFGLSKRKIDIKKAIGQSKIGNNILAFKILNHFGSSLKNILSMIRCISINNVV